MKQVPDDLVLYSLVSLYIMICIVLLACNFRGAGGG